MYVSTALCGLLTRLTSSATFYKFRNIASDDALRFGIGQHLLDADLVDGVRRPWLPRAPLRGLSAPGDEVRNQRIEVGFTESFDGERPIVFTERGEFIFELRKRRSPQFVTASEVVVA